MRVARGQRVAAPLPPARGAPCEDLSKLFSLRSTRGQRNPVSRRSPTSPDSGHSGICLTTTSSWQSIQEAPRITRGVATLIVQVRLEPCVCDFTGCMLHACVECMNHAPSSSGFHFQWGHIQQRFGVLHESDPTEKLRRPWPCLTLRLCGEEWSWPGESIPAADDMLKSRGAQLQNIGHMYCCRPCYRIGAHVRMCAERMLPWS